MVKLLLTCGLLLEIQGDFSVASPARTSSLKGDGWLVLELP